MKNSIRLLVILIYTDAGIILKWVPNKENVAMCTVSGSGQGAVEGVVSMGSKKGEEFLAIWVATSAPRCQSVIMVQSPCR